MSLQEEGCKRQKNKDVGPKPTMHCPLKIQFHGVLQARSVAMGASVSRCLPSAAQEVLSSDGVLRKKAIVCLGFRPAATGLRDAR